MFARWHLKRKIPFRYFWKMFNIRKISQILSKGGRCRLSLGRGWQKSNEGRTGRTDGRINLFGINRRFWLLQGHKIIIYAHAGKWLTWLLVFSFCSCSCLSFSKFTFLMNLCLSFFLIPSISNSYVLNLLFSLFLIHLCFCLFTLLFLCQPVFLSPLSSTNCRYANIN